MSLIDDAVSHFSSQEVRSIEIPEWNTTLYAKPFSLDDKARCISRAKGNDVDYTIYCVILGIVDKSGEPVFTFEDKPKLRTSVDPKIVNKLASLALGLEVSDEEREKN